jgi:hypothetical protein
MKFQA